MEKLYLVHHIFLGTETNLIFFFFFDTKSFGVECKGFFFFSSYVAQTHFF